MISQEQVPAVIDHMVYGSDGKKIGEARHVFLDDRSGLPEWVTVRTGMFGSHEAFIPIHQAELVEDHLEVPYDRAKIKDAPHITAERGRLSEQQERELYRYYGVDWGDSGSRQGTGGTGQSGADTSAGWEPASSGGTPGAAGAAGAAGAMGGMRGKDTASAEPAAETRSSAKARTGDDSGVHARDAMTLSEEQLRVRVQNEETGRARLHKYVTTEEVQQSVPLHYEEAHLVHEPITDANVGDATRGADISEDDFEITLHAERPITEIEAVPVERVRLVAEEHTRQETVRGEVRKERLDVEGAVDEREQQGRGREKVTGPERGAGGSGGSGSGMGRHDQQP